MKKERTKARLADLVLNSGQLQWLPANPRQWRQEDINKTKKSLQTDPDFLEEHPLLVVQHGKKLVVFAGNLRTTAAKELKWETIEAVLYTPETEEDKTTILRRSLLDNGQFGSWDYDALANEWHEFQLTDFGIPAWDAAKDEEESPQQVEEDDFNEETDAVETRCKAGDIWQLGEHRLMCGDSTKTEDIQNLTGGAKIDMCLTDPPYGMFLDTDFSTIHGSLKCIGRKNRTKGNKYGKVIGDNEDFKPELIQTIFDNFPNIKEMFLFGADYFAELLPDKNKGSWLCWDKRKESQADAIGSEFELIWSKNKHKRRMLRHDWFGFLSSENQKDARNRVHPTQKPVTLLVDILTQWGQETESVVDLYGGSGSILIACEQMQKRCFTMEIDPHYCDVIIARWEKLTGQQAKKIN